MSGWELVIGLAIVITAFTVTKDGWRQVRGWRARSKLIMMSGDDGKFTYVSVDGKAGFSRKADAKGISAFFNRRYQVISARDVIGVEGFDSDRVELQSANNASIIGRGVMGGLALGPVGALVGGLTGSKKSVAQVSEIGIRILLNGSYPFFDIYLYRGSPKPITKLKREIGAQRNALAVIKSIAARNTLLEDGDALRRQY